MSKSHVRSLLPSLPFLLPFLSRQLLEKIVQKQAAVGGNGGRRQLHNKSRAQQFEKLHRHGDSSETDKRTDEDHKRHSLKKYPGISKRTQRVRWDTGINFDEHQTGNGFIDAMRDAFQIQQPKENGNGTTYRASPINGNGPKIRKNISYGLLEAQESKRLKHASLANEIYAWKNSMTTKEPNYRLMNPETNKSVLFWRLFDKMFDYKPRRSDLEDARLPKVRIPYKDEDKFVVGIKKPPPKASLNELKTFYLNEIDSILPKFLRGGNKTKNLSVHDTTHSSLDLPMPSLVYVQVSSLEADEGAWSNNTDQGRLYQILFLIEQAKFQGITLLGEILLQRREKAFFWICFKMLEPAPELVDRPIDIWRGSSLFEGAFTEPQSSSATVVLDVMATALPPEYVLELRRRRRGLSIIIQNLVTMLHSAWRLNMEEKELFLKQERLAQEKGVESRTEEQDKVFRSILSTADPADDFFQPIRAHEIFTSVAHIIAYLHTYNMVPREVYSVKHIFLHQNEQSIMQRLMETVQFSYFGEYGYKKTLTDGSVSIDWACYQELLIAIASERGLGVAACTSIMQFGEELQLEYDWKLKNKQQTSKSVYNVEARNHKRTPISRSIVKSAAETIIMTGAYDGMKPEERPQKMIDSIKALSILLGGLDRELATQLLQSRYINLRGQKGIQILDIPLESGSWDLSVLYEVLLGMIDRLDLNHTLEIWRRIETQARSKPSKDTGMKDNTLGDKYPLVEKNLDGIASNKSFAHPPEVLSKLLHFLNNQQRAPHLVRHVIVTAVTPEILKHASIFNPLLSYAGQFSDEGFGKYLIEDLKPTASILSTAMNMCLRFGMVDMAKQILTQKKRLGISTDDNFDFGLIVHDTFRQNYDDGVALVNRAIRDQTIAETGVSIEDFSVPFSNDITLDKVPPKALLKIGDGAWIALLNAAIDKMDYKNVILALSGLGLDLADPQIATKMGTHVFTIVLRGIVKFRGSKAGIDIWKAHCQIPGSREHFTMQRGKQRGLSGILFWAEMQDALAALEYVPRKDMKPEQIINTKTNEKFFLDDGGVKMWGLVVPDTKTLMTIVISAVEERNLASKAISIYHDTSPKERTKEQHAILEKALELRKRDGQEGWLKSMTWCKKTWLEMGMGLMHWENMIGATIKANRDKNDKSNSLNADSSESTPEKNKKKAPTPNGLQEFDEVDILSSQAYQKQVQATIDKTKKSHGVNLLSADELAEIESVTLEDFKKKLPIINAKLKERTSISYRPKNWAYVPKWMQDMQNTQMTERQDGSDATIATPDYKDRSNRSAHQEREIRRRILHMLSVDAFTVTKRMQRFRIQAEDPEISKWRMFQELKDMSSPLIMKLLFEFKDRGEIQDVAKQVYKEIEENPKEMLHMLRREMVPKVNLTRRREDVARRVSSTSNENDRRKM